MQTRVAAARKNSGKVVRKVDRAQRARGLHGFVIGDKNREIAMGCALSSPVELIRVQRHGHAAFRCAVAEMQGWRVGHEDAHAMRCDASSATCFVLDGHGGDGAALFAAPELLEEVSKREKAPDVPSDAHLEEAFSTVDKRLRGYFQEHAEKDSGTTVVGAVCAKTKDGSYKVKLLNCGDSRAVVVRNPKEEASPEPLIRRPGHIEALGTKGNPVKGEAQVAAPTGKNSQHSQALHFLLALASWSRESMNGNSEELPAVDRENPLIAKLPPQWFESTRGDAFPDSVPIYKPKGREQRRRELDQQQEELGDVCQGLPGSLSMMRKYKRGDLQLSDIDELMKSYDQLAGYTERETPQNMLFCGPVEEETWRMRRKLKTGMYTHKIGENYSCNESQFSSHAHARFFLEPCDELGVTREEAPFVPRKLNKFGIMEMTPEINLN
eukprot:s1032_g13.t1